MAVQNMYWILSARGILKIGDLSLTMTFGIRRDRVVLI